MFSGRKKINHTTLLGKLYVPLTTVLLFALGNHFVPSLAFDPLTSAQNSRVSFQAIVEHFQALPVNRPDRLTLLMSGNSQTHAIMDAQPEDRVTASWLSEFLNANPPNKLFEVRLRSLPNLTMSELLILLVQSENDSAHRPDVIVAGIALDGLRWIEPREEYATLARSRPLHENLQNLSKASPELPHAVQAVSAILSGGRSITVAAEPGGAREPLLEQRILKILNLLPVFQARTRLYSRFAYSLQDFRNKFFGITTATRRKIPPEFYKTNMELIGLALKFAQIHDVHMVLYAAPLRLVEPNPYDQGDILRFREELPKLCNQYGGVCLDYSELIPEKLWTMYPDDQVAGFGGQRDYAHFTGKAHQRLARQLKADMQSDLESWRMKKALQLAQLGHLTTPK